LMARATELARVLASRPRRALIETKRLTRELIDLDTRSAINEINETFVRCLNSDEHREHLTRFYEKLKKGSPAGDR
jgi:enoyl-CoA hydratase/carnithine racemase